MVMESDPAQKVVRATH